jgi:hypothetical protein
VRHRSAKPHLRAHLGAQRIGGDEALRGFQVPERPAVAGVETLIGAGKQTSLAPPGKFQMCFDKPSVFFGVRTRALQAWIRPADIISV